MTRFEKLILRLLYAILFRLMNTTASSHEGLPGMRTPRTMDILPGETQLLVEVEQELGLTREQLLAIF